MRPLALRDHRLREFPNTHLCQQLGHRKRDRRREIVAVINLRGAGALEVADDELYLPEVRAEPVSDQVGVGEPLRGIAYDDGYLC